MVRDAFPFSDKRMKGRTQIEFERMSYVLIQSSSQDIAKVELNAPTVGCETMSDFWQYPDSSSFQIH